MSDKIIDLSSYLGRAPSPERSPRTMALWGAEGERSRFALPLWRIVHLTNARRGVIFWRSATGDMTPHPFFALDLANDPARVEVEVEVSPDEMCEHARASMLHDLGRDGVVVHLGRRDDRVWCLLADGGDQGREPPSVEKREDILFLAGECAGLLFARDLAKECELAPGS